jgi:hypothetical protein
LSLMMSVSLSCISIGSTQRQLNRNRCNFIYRNKKYRGIVVFEKLRRYLILFLWNKILLTII